VEKVVDLCKIFHNLVGESDIDGTFVDAIRVIGEASQAVLDDEERTVTDCAYGLEEILGIIRKNLAAKKEA